MLFIIIHQVYELWFKEVLHEVDHLVDLLDRDDGPRASRTLHRVRTILKTLVGQLDVLETMTPVEFEAFRDRLETASGFQSYQFRELEFALGRKNEAVLERFAVGSPAHARLLHRFEGRHLWQVFLGFLSRRGHPVPETELSRDARPWIEPNREVQDVLVDVYRNDPDLTRLCEHLVDLDEGLQEWRYRHVKMVERTIGAQSGTGGSSGAQYLRGTLFEPLFPDLWAIRSEL